MLFRSLGHQKGSIEIGKDADLVIFDPDARRRVDAACLEHRHPVTPYHGEELRGVVEMTLLRGEKIFDRGVFRNPPKGIQCFRA